MQFGNSAGNFGGSAFRRTFGHHSACGLSNLVVLLPNSMQIVHNWSEKGVLVNYIILKKYDVLRWHVEERVLEEWKSERVTESPCNAGRKLKNAFGN